MDESFAYVTVLTRIEYLHGFYALYVSLIENCGGGVNLVVIIPQNKEELKSSLIHLKKYKQWNFEILEIEFDFNKIQNINVSKSYWKDTYFKLKIFGLTRYKKIVYTDCDVLIMRNINELFSCKHMSAVASSIPMHPDIRLFTTGLLVVEPNIDDEKKLLTALDSFLDNENLYGDQQIVREVFAKEWETNEELHLPIDYCVLFCWINKMIRQQKYKIRNLKILHFSGSCKPWDYKLKNILSFLIKDCLRYGCFQSFFLLLKYIRMCNQSKRIFNKFNRIR